jgi:adenine/guanine phosphoribosyltransferase-like PRPP-binding protein
MKKNPKKNSSAQRLPDTNTRFLSYDETYMLAKQYEQQLRREGFDFIIGIARSGVVPAAIIAQMCDLPLRCVYTTRISDQVSIDPEIDLAGKKILIVEDVMGRGYTAKKVYDFLSAQGAICKVFCLFYDEITSEYAPDYGIGTTHFIQPLWDRKNNSPAAKMALKNYNGATLDSTEECLGSDLDGILLPDTNRRWNKNSERLKFILNYRDKFLPNEIIPPLEVHKTVYIITGRPLVDFERTTQWLRENKFDNIQLVCRNPDTHGDSDEEVADFKAAKILEIGITRFYESDLMQALLIAEKVPVCDIIWFQLKQQILIKATKV